MSTPYAAHLDVKLDAALKQVRTILDNTRQPLYAADVPHAYDDKYELAEWLVRGSIAALLQCFANLGLTDEGLATLRAWSQTRSVSLRLRAEEICGFLREETRKVESPHAHVTEVKSSSGAKTSVTQSVITTVTEYFWSLDFRFELLAFQGTDETPYVSLLSRGSSVEIKTTVKATPRPPTVLRPPSDVSLTWLLQQLDAEGRVAFAIDRTDAGCHTPRRNRQVEAALTALSDLNSWCRRVPNYFVSELFPAQCLEGLDLGVLRDDQIFVPVLPVFESNTPKPEGGALLPADYLNAFLEDQKRSLTAKCVELGRVFPPDAAAISAAEARLVVTLLHAARVCASTWHGLEYIEKMLRDQLVAAIGKELTPTDFSAYMDFHFRKLVKPEVHPRPFSYAVRRIDHSPEGALSLEVDGAGGGMAAPISTSVASSRAGQPMSFALDASTRVRFLGDRHLHAWVTHQFSGSGELSLRVVARARQFSSFILLVGRIASAESFEPKAAIIVQNKDLLKIPLMLERLPTPKEFRDAIESLSPEQQRFAKAFRAMQLESTLFGICVLQIKPQLETLLKLPSDSLTKEIKLNQELLNLFIEYQIPSDLLSYDGPEDAPAADKLACVRDYVARMDEMIALAKRREIEEAHESRELEGDTNRPHAYPASAESWGAANYAHQPMMGMAPGMGPPPPMMPMAMAPPGYGAPPPPSVPVSRRVTADARLGAPPPPPPPPAPPAPRQEPQQAPVQVEVPRPQGPAAGPSGSAETGPITDYTLIPKELDNKIDLLDDDSALRSTIINVGKVWSRESRANLLADAVESNVTTKEQEGERNKAFDLLDALSKSGALVFEDASLHVVIAATHSFDRTLLDTVIQGNINPIEKVERSLMIMASTIHRRPVADLLAEDQRARFSTYSPKLMPPADD